MDHFVGYPTEEQARHEYGGRSGENKQTNIDEEPPTDVSSDARQSLLAAD